MRSFDIFDTVLTRNVGDPQAVFLCVGQAAAREGLISISAIEFKQLRIKAETEARRKQAGEEVTLEDIYNCLEALSGILPVAATRLRQLELDIESAGLRPVKTLADEVASARLDHGKVAFLSDMYLPTKFLETKLRAHGLFQDGDHLLVSAEQKATKQTGKLYLNFVGNCGLKPGELLHRGDNWASDVQMPRRLGIRAEHFGSTALNRYERILERFSEQTEAVTSFFAGASRLARLDVGTEPPRRKAIREVAAGVAGPSLVGYVIWILQRATQLRLKRIYFLARDGQILLKIARLAVPVVGFSGELKYLYASRQALRLPSTNLADAQSLRWSLDDTTFLSVKSFLERVGLEPTGLTEVLSRHGLDPASAEKNLDRAARGTLTGLIEDPGFREAIAREVDIRKRRLSEYLVQEGVVGTEEIGIVDLGWNGTLQVALERLLKEKKAVLPVGFYFGLSQRASQAGIGKREAFFFDEGRQTGCMQRDYWVEPLMETFCMADHGVTLKYEAGEAGMIPVLKTERNDLALAAGLSIQQEAILKFSEFALNGYHPGFDPETLRPAIDALLGEFWNSPTAMEAEAWGTYAYADDQTEACTFDFGQPLGLTDCMRSIYRGQLTPPHRAGWAAGGLRRSSALVRLTLPPAVKIGSWLRRHGWLKSIR